MLDTIENIIFDFGGVILNLDEQATYIQMGELLQKTKQEMQVFFDEVNFFDFECGKISSDEFITNIQSLVPHSITRQQIITAWNAMLLDFPKEHVALLINLKSKFRTFLLSNTNAIHVEEFEHDMKKQGIQHTMYDLFEDVWYSSSIGMRKPHVETFTAMLQKANLDPSKTLFLDDRHDNLEGAKKAGLQTLLVTKTNSIMTIFSAFV